MSPRTGRPKIENPMKERITVRLDDESVQLVKAYCQQKNVDKAEAIRRGIDKLRSEIKK